jgi:phospholipid/cholesterol/gamma-HCH transport system substrate-binding protein
MSRPGFRKFQERNLRLIGAVTGVVLAVFVAGALDFANLPFVSGTRTYHAMFANAGGLASGDMVAVAGVRVGAVSSIELRGSEVEVTFTVADGVRVGQDSSASMQVLTPIGQEFLEVVPAGPGRLRAPIPEARTTIPQTLVSDLSTLSQETGRIDLPQLEHALDATAGTLQGIPKATVASALSGLARLSSIIASRQQDLSVLVGSASKLSGVLATHSAALVDLVGQGDLVLRVLEQRRAAIRELLATTSTLGEELTSLVHGHEAQLTTLLTNLDSVSAILASDSSDLGRALPLLAAFSRYSANATGSGPFADFTLPTLLIPDNVIAQCAGQAIPDPAVGCRA